MAILKTINLTTEADAIRKEKFGDDSGKNGKFSAFVQDALLELKKKDHDPQYVQTKINEIDAEMMALATEKSSWVKKQQTINQEKFSNTKDIEIMQRNSTRVPATAEDTLNKALQNLEFYFGLKTQDTQTITLAKALIAYQDTNPLEKKDIQIIEFAHANSLPFKKEFGMLKRYNLPYTIKQNEVLVQ